ncbi:MAG: FAD-binding oxidoreductase, partial [Chloroflexi bacterium]|nr:FAD-binding oxidoreductase [Chloroflexota bacterium]
MAAERFDVLVVGGGAIGLALAWRLRLAGASVAVLERGAFTGTPGESAPFGQATWASAGMLVPLAETHSPCPL